MAPNPEHRSASEQLGVTPARWRCSGRRRIRPAAVASRSEPLPVLWFTKLNKVCTYGIVATQGSRFAHLGMAAVAAGDSEATQRKLGIDGGGLRASSG
jgi:hypothetical protein